MARYHAMQLSEPWYSMVKNGERTVDIRCDVDKICDGDVVGFYKDVDRWDDTVRCEVRYVRMYKNAQKMLAHEDCMQWMPGKTNEEIISLLNDMWSPQLQKQHGFIAFEFFVLK